MKIGVIYNSKVPQSILAVFCLMAFNRDDTTVAVDMNGLNEGEMTTAIDAALTDGTQDRAYVVCPKATSYSTAGVPSDTNIADLAEKLKGTVVSPYNAVLDYSAASGGKNVSQRIWEHVYPTVTAPKIVQYVGGVTFPKKVESTATSAAAGALTHTGAFTAGALVGYYVAITSATKGVGQVKKIASNTTGVLTLESNWGVTPTGTIKYAIYEHFEDALKDVTIPLAIYAEYYNPSALGNGVLMDAIDLGINDKTIVPLVNGMSSSHQDLEFSEKLHQNGLRILWYNNR